MDTAPPPPPSLSSSQTRTGLAIASLAVGVLAFFSSILVVGGFVGLLAIVLGTIHIAKRQGPNGMAWTGIALALLSIVLSVVLGVLYLKGFRTATASWAEMTGTAEVDSNALTSDFADWVGEEIPEFTLTAVDGTEFHSRDLNGRRVVLDFWATWCPPCKREIPHFVRLSEEYPREELLIIGISSEDEDTLVSFMEENGVNYPVVSTDALPPPFDTIVSIPTTFFIDRNGIIQNVLVGYHDYDTLKRLALMNDGEAEINGGSQP